MAMEYVMGSGNTSVMKLEIPNKFENQAVSPYMARIFPFALNFDSGGADYIKLFHQYSGIPASMIHIALRARRSLSGLQKQAVCNLISSEVSFREHKNL